MNISQQGLDLIKSFEGFRSDVYRCPAGLLTIGYGHALRPYEDFKTITKEQAEELLLKDVQWAELCIKERVTTPLTQNQYDALVSFIYNIGIGAFLNSSVFSALQKGGFEKVITVMKQYRLCKGKPLPGLIKRREAEVTLFLTQEK